MCVIAVSKKGARQPSSSEIKTAFEHNPDGAGYMYARAGKVHIRKGFMTLDELQDALDQEQFTDQDAVVYHFRVSTQAGVNPKMTHPFPVYHDIRAMNLQSVKCDIGIAHNGIIRLTSSKDEHEYSDTAIFIADYMSSIIRHPEDIHDQSNLDLIDDLAKSKFALMDGNGSIEIIGSFTNDNGILWSNDSYRPRTVYTYKRFSLRDPEFWNSHEFTDYLIPQTNT